MGVTDKSLGPLPGPKEEMALKALMEGWSRYSRTPRLASHLTSPPARKTDPGPGLRSAHQLGNGKSRARCQNLERSGRLRLDIDFYGRRQLELVGPNDGRLDDDRSHVVLLRGAGGELHDVPE